MQHKRDMWTRVRRMAGALMGVALLAAGDVLAQATPKPPERMTYQGFLTGADGVPLGNTAPKAYDVVFRIHDSEQGGEVLWGEQQTVTLDKGYFSVLLGEGGPVSGVPNAGVNLSSLFVGASASDRYVGVTVKGVGTGNTDVEILPRVRLLSAPYAYLAASAVKLVQTTGADLLTSSGNTVTVSGSLVANALTAGSLGVTNAVTAASVVATSQVTSATVAASTSVSTPTLTAGTIVVTNALTAGSVTAANLNTAGALSAPNLTVGTATLTNVAMTSALLGGMPLARAGHGFAENAPVRIVTGIYLYNPSNQTLNDPPEQNQTAHSVQRISTGRYRITLTTPFSGSPHPVCIVTGTGSNPFTFSVSQTSTANNIIDNQTGPGWGQFDIWCKYIDPNGGGWFNRDASFNFMIIGAY